jgi:short-subunit dehydrogenase
MFKTKKWLLIIVVLALYLNYIFGPAHKINSSEFKQRYGPWCIIAGASQGLGEAFAREIASHGLNLVLIARREKQLNELAENIRNEFKGLEVRTISADLGDTISLLEKIHKVTSDVIVGSLIYNAAWSSTGPFLERTPSDLNLAVGVNVQTPLLLLNDLLPKFAEQKRGGIILVSSTAGLFGAKYIATYAATKAYQMTLAAGLWDEMRQHGVDVVSTIAGGIRTSGLSTVFGGKEPPGTQTAEEVALESVQFLASRSGPTIIPGTFNRFINSLLNLLPRKFSTMIIGAKIEADMLQEMSE